jgi:hypothetical protein
VRRHRAKALPAVMLDVGTNNAELRADVLYWSYPRKRMK